MEYADYADAAYNGLMGWYDWGSGQWSDGRSNWWNWANALTAVINYHRLRPVSNIVDILSTTFYKNKSSNFAFRPYSRAAEVAADAYEELRHGHPSSVDKHMVYDDEAWWALAWLSAYEVTIDEGKPNADYLNMAVTIFHNMTSAWSWPCGGGLWWNTPDWLDVQGGITGLFSYYKNAIVNELLFALAARLAVILPGDWLWVSWAKAALNWFDKSGMQNSSTGLINDGLNSYSIENENWVFDCTNNGGATFTYNQGVILGGLADMYRLTGDRCYLDRGWTIFKAVISSTLVDPPTGALVEPGGPDNNLCQFKGIFVRNLSYLYDAEDNEDRKASYASFFADNANSIWNNNKGPRISIINDAAGGISYEYLPGPFFGYKWQGLYDFDPDSIRQCSALDALVAAIRLGSPPPPVSANRLDVFTTDLAGHVWSTGWEATHKWGTWYEISPSSTPTPNGFGSIAAVSRRQNHLNVFALDGISRDIWSAWWDKSTGAWSDWGKLPTPPGVAPVGSNGIQVLARSSSQLDLFVQSYIHGSGTQLWWTEWNDETSWSAWSAVSPTTTPAPLGTGDGATPFVAVARDAGHMDVFMNDNFGGGNVWWSAWDAVATPPIWSPWTKIGTSLSSGHLVSAISRDAWHIDVFTTTSGSGITTTAGSWIPWTPITGWLDWVNLSSDPSQPSLSSVVATSPGHLEAIAVGHPPGAVGNNVLRNQGNRKYPALVWSGWQEIVPVASGPWPPIFNNNCASVAMDPDHVYLVTIAPDPETGRNTLWAGQYSLSGGEISLPREGDAQGSNATVIGCIAS